MPLKVLTVFGTRPEAIKMAPVVRELQARPEAFEVVVTVTAQHRQMLDQVLDHFRIRPHHDLDVMTPRQTLTRLTTSMLEGLERVLGADRPDIVLVHGDAATTFAASLAAFYAKVPVGHVEAGLRTYLKYSPWPEEMNRRLTGLMADVHFAPTPQAGANLRREHVPEESIYVTGNTVIDALLWTVRADHAFDDPELERLVATPGGPAAPRRPGSRPIVLVECHRRENWGDRMTSIFSALRRFAEDFPEARLLVSAHLNPEAGAVARRELDGVANAHLFAPLPYPDWVNLMARCDIIFTDSGGLQEEAPSLGRPLVLARDDTERPEAVAAGTVVLVGADGGRIVETLARLVRDRAFYDSMAGARNPFGDGRAASRTADGLLHHFGLCSERPGEFTPS